MTVRNYFLIFFTLFLLFAAYSFFIYTEGTAVNENIKMSSEAVEGKFLWQKYNCNSCHQLYGLGGYIGPDLTNTMSAQGKGEPYARAILQYGTDAMPNFFMEKNEVNSLVEFLKYTDKTGNFPERNVKMNWYGSFKIQ